MDAPSTLLLGFKWFYAFSIAPVDSSTPQARPTNATPSPFYVPAAKMTKRAAENQDTSSTASFMWGSNPQGSEQAKRPRTGILHAFDF